MSRSRVRLERVSDLSRRQRAQHGLGDLWFLLLCIFIFIVAVCSDRRSEVDELESRATRFVCELCAQSHVLDMDVGGGLELDGVVRLDFNTPMRCLSILIRVLLCEMFTRRR